MFLPNIIKIYPYYFELYRFKVGPLFETQFTCEQILRQDYRLSYSTCLTAHVTSLN